MHKSCACLFSGGIDSTTCIYWALREGYRVNALTVNYGQLHSREILSSYQIASGLGIEHKILDFELPWKSCALLDEGIAAPKDRTPDSMTDIPSTYVPARNTFLLSLALSWAEALDMDAVIIGAHIQHFSGYPDCRPDYLAAFQRMADLGTKRGREGTAIKILAPLIGKSKSEIIKLASSLGVPLENTWSCYRAGDAPCGSCDACILRAKGFHEAGLEDPLLRAVIRG